MGLSKGIVLSILTNLISNPKEGAKKPDIRSATPMDSSFAEQRYTKSTCYNLLTIYTYFPLSTNFNKHF